MFTASPHAFAVSFNGHPVPTVAMRLRHGYPNDSALMIYPLDPAWILMGENTVEVKLTKSNQAVATAMQLVGVEVQFNYWQIPIQVATD